MAKRFWISWEEPGDDGDFRPVQWPLPKTIAQWWCSGEAGDGSYFNLCAVVDAEDEQAAKAMIAGAWRPTAWRFCEEHAADWRPEGGRFPWKALGE